MKTLLLVLLIIISNEIISQTPQYYNYNTPGELNSFPFNMPGGKAVQWLIRPGELNHPYPVPHGNSITAVYFFISGPSSRFFWHLTVKLGQAAIESLPAGEVYGGSLTTVYYKTNVTVNSVDSNWMKITLDTPFPFDTSLALIVDVSQCGSSGSSMYLHHTQLTGLRRCYGEYGCPNGYNGQDGRIAHIGIDVVMTPQNVYFWNPQNSGTTNSFYSVKAVNNLVGWAAGKNATVRRTTDGGLTWTDGNPNAGVILGDINTIESINGDTAWCSTTTSSATYIYRTTTGGYIWTQVFEQEGGCINAIHFTSEKHGYAVGNPVGGAWVIWYTSNGYSWDTTEYFPQVGNENGYRNSLFFAGVYAWFGTNNSRVYMTENPVCTWKSSFTQGLLNLMSIHFNSNTLGLAGGETLMRTTNGGSGWQSIGIVPGSGNIYGIEGGGNNFWYIRGKNIYTSTNRGDSWLQCYSVEDTLYGIDFANINGSLVGWAVGSGGTIVRMTTDSLEVIKNQNSRIPENFSLSQNYPNPFNPTTKIKFDIPPLEEDGGRIVSVKIYDILGREVATLVNEQLPPGTYEVSWDGSNYPSGVYFYSMIAGQAGTSSVNYSVTKKMVIVK